MTSVPLLPHLLDILSDPTSEHLIVTGGYGIVLKQAHLHQTANRTLIQPFPTARSTVDLDFSLPLQFLLNPDQGIALRRWLDGLGYKPVQRNAYWQFELPGTSPHDKEGLFIDFLTRLPETEEERREIEAKPNGQRVKRRHTPHIELHGRSTPEAFAIDDLPIRIGITGEGSDGVRRECSVRVPHPYAWINMKVAAAHDWLAQGGGPTYGARHAFDVYLLVAMLTEHELAGCRRLCTAFADHLQAREIRSRSQALYSTASSPGFLEASRQAALAGYTADHATFWEALQAVLIPAETQSATSREKFDAALRAVPDAEPLPEDAL